MENFSRSKSTREVGIHPPSMNDLRSYSTSDYSNNNDNNNNFTEVKIKKGGNKSRINSSSSFPKNWSFNDPELKRKKRVAGYKAYSVEGKMKGSFRKSIKWIKDTCNALW